MVHRRSPLTPEGRRRLVALVTVTLFPQPRGRRGFDPAAVDIDFGDEAETPVTEA